MPPHYLQQLPSDPHAPCHPLPPGHLALLAPLPLPHLAPCHQPPASPPLPSGPPTPPPSCPTTPIPCYPLPPLSSGTPSASSQSHWLLAIASPASPAPTTPTPIWTSCPNPPNIITKGPLHSKEQFEFFRVSKFFDVHFNLTSHGLNLISCENNIFQFTWKNSQNSHEATPFLSIR